MRVIIKTMLAASLVLTAMLPWDALRAQGTVSLNNWDSGMGIYLNSSLQPAPAGTYVEILGGPFLGALVPLTSESGAGPVFRLRADGVNGNGAGTGSFFDVGYGVVPGVPPSGIGYFQIVAWLGAPSLDGAALRAASPTWLQQVGTPDPLVGGVPGVPRSLSIPGPIILGVVPEPSSCALAGLGALALLTALCRRGPSPRKES